MDLDKHLRNPDQIQGKLLDFALRRNRHLLGNHN